jgi:hypothetical protein
MKILAFSAMLTTGVNLDQHQTVAYNNVITNIGVPNSQNSNKINSLYVLGRSYFTKFYQMFDNRANNQSFHML